MDSLSPQPSLLRHRSFVLFWCARTSTSGAYQMQAVAVGWQLYDLTNDPLDLGLVGLMQFFPVVVLALVIGQTADHFDRRACRHLPSGQGDLRRLVRARHLAGLA